MDKIIEILINEFIIKEIIIKDFTVLNKSLDIQININSKKYGNCGLLFKDVKTLNVDSNTYGVSEISSIVLEDISEMNWEKINYKVMISEDAMIFYCKDIYLK